MQVHRYDESMRKYRQPFDKESRSDGDSALFYAPTYVDLSSCVSPVLMVPMNTVLQIENLLVNLIKPPEVYQLPIS